MTNTLRRRQESLWEHPAFSPRKYVAKLLYKDGQQEFALISTKGTHAVYFKSAKEAKNFGWKKCSSV